MPAKHKHFRPWKRQLLVLFLAVVAMYVVLPQLGSFRHSLSALTSARWSDVLWAVIFAASSYLFAAGTYKALSLHFLRYGRTVLIQVAGMFVNRLLPAGIGSIGVNYAYLRKSNHTAAEAASVVAVNNIIGIGGHLLLTLSILSFSYRSLPSAHIYHVRNLRLILAAATVIIIAWCIFYYQHKDRIKRGLRLFVEQILLYRKKPRRLLAALACSMGLTMCNVLSLWFCVQSLQISIPFIAVLIVFSLGIILGTAAPTPGGLGGVEAGLVAGFVIYHIDGSMALAIVLIYRLITYWLPLLVGAVSFTASERSGYI